MSQVFPFGASPSIGGCELHGVGKGVNHYNDKPFKYRAAVFLIENMLPYYGYDGARVDTIRKALTMVHNLNGFIYDKDLIRAANDFPYSELKKDASLCMLRACGIPAICHYYLYSPNLSGRHTWAAVRDTTGRDVPFSAPGMEVGRDIDIDLMKGKVYRRSYGAYPAHSPASIDAMDVLPEFRNPYMKDVSVHYTGENTIRAHVTKTDNRYMYLSVQTGQRTYKRMNPTEILIICIFTPVLHNAFVREVADV
jgi:hypothetical protein